MRLMLASVLIASCLVPARAQTPPPAAAEPCYKDKPVDEYVAELRKLQKKKGTHNPLPTDICLFGMCTHGGGPNGDKPRESAPVPEPTAPEKRTATPGDESSSKQGDLGIPTTTVGPPAYDPVLAAHNVDVGDYYYGEKNYRGALMRYQEAAQEKPGDAGIHLRMGRAWEGLKAPERAYVEYDAAAKLEPEGKSAAEAAAAMERLRPQLAKVGIDPAALSASNQPQPAPCLKAPAADALPRAPSR